MSKLGFDKTIKQIQKAERKFFKRAMAVAQKEFKSNFDNEKNSETGVSWEAVLRGYPPPILDVTGNLRANALSSGNVVIMPRKAILIVDPIDDRGRGYAKYHQDGIGVNERAFLTQSNTLTSLQEKILLDVHDEIF